MELNQALSALDTLQRKMAAFDHAAGLIYYDGATVAPAGTAANRGESMAILSGLEGVKVAATFVMVDRKEKGQGEKGAMQEIEEEFGFPVYSVVDVYDIIAYLEEDPANEENVTRIKNYLAINGAKV